MIEPAAWTKALTPLYADLSPEEATSYEEYQTWECEPCMNNSRIEMLAVLAWRYPDRIGEFENMNWAQQWRTDAPRSPDEDCEGLINGWDDSTVSIDFLHRHEGGGTVLYIADIDADTDAVEHMALTMQSGDGWASVSGPEMEHGR
jgi:hypothetical protein